jgi:hypothetical protein
MNRSIHWIIAAGLVAAGAGCSTSYQDQRPPVDQLNPDDTGLQSKDIVNATDRMAAEILSDPTINARPTKLLIVFDGMDNKTLDQNFPTSIFISRLRVKLGELGKGRIQLIENRDKLRQLQSAELEQTGEGGAPGPAGIQPDYSLTGTVTEMANRSTSYFLADFAIVGLKGADARQQIWTGQYEVTTNR